MPSLLAYPMQMMDPWQVSPDRFPSAASVEKVVPEENKLAAELGDVGVGDAQELVFRLYGLQQLNIDNQTADEVLSNFVNKIR